MSGQVDLKKTHTTRTAGPDRLFTKINNESTDCV